MHVTPTEAAQHERGDCDERYCELCRDEKREDR